VWGKEKGRKEGGEDEGDVGIKIIQKVFGKCATRSGGGGKRERERERESEKEKIYI